MPPSIAHFRLPHAKEDRAFNRLLRRSSTALQTQVSPQNVAAKRTPRDVAITMVIMYFLSLIGHEKAASVGGMNAVYAKEVFSIASPASAGGFDGMYSQETSRPRKPPHLQQIANTLQCTWRGWAVDPKVLDRH